MASAAARLAPLLACASAAPTIFGSWQAPHKSKATGDAQSVTVAIAGTTGVTPYPGYVGDLSMAGDVYVGSAPNAGEGEEELRILFYLWDADPNCAEGVARIRVAGACSISVHTGGKCDEAGDAFAIQGDSPWVVYTTMNRSATGDVSLGSIGSISPFLGRTVVVRDAAGARVACSPLQRMETTRDLTQYSMEEWQRYPGYEGGLHVMGTAGMADVAIGDKTGQILLADISNADPECASGHRTGIANSCGIHVHAGKTCTDAAAIGGHFFNRTMFAAGEDPWALVRYTAGRSTTGGSLRYTVQTAMTGFAMPELVGRALVVHDATGARIACALVQAQARSGHDAN